SLNGWGWVNGAYWLSQATTLTFATGGTHTLRIQTREDGAQIDQLIFSAATYLSNAPGPISNDHTIVPKPGGNEPPSAPGAPATRSPAHQATGVSTSTALSWSSSGATSYDVRFGTANPPPSAASNQSASTFTPPSSLAFGTTYFWQIVAHNSAGDTTGPV